jgi:hypothetical protein
MLVLDHNPLFASRGASSAAAKIYSKDGRFGPIPAGFRVFGVSGGEYSA